MAQTTKKKTTSTTATAAAKRNSSAKPTAKSARTTSTKTENKKRVSTGASRAQARTANKASDVTATQPKTKMISTEVQGIMLIALGLFFAFAFFMNSTGVVGAFVESVCKGLFGSASAIFFVYFILTGINCFLDKNSGQSIYKWILLLGLMICSAIIYALSMGETSFIDGGFLVNLRELYDMGISGKGGGILGGFICKVLVMLIGPIGGWVFIIATVLVLVIMLTGISIEAVFRKFINFIKKVRTSAARRAELEVELEPLENYNENYDIEEYGSENSNRRTRKQSWFKKLFNKNGEVYNERENYVEDEITDFENLPHTTELTGYTKKNNKAMPKKKDSSEKAKFTPTKPQRFVFEEDESILDDILNKNEEEQKRKFSFDDLPFDLDDITTGTISQIDPSLKPQKYDVFKDDSINVDNSKPKENVKNKNNYNLDSLHDNKRFEDINVPSFLDTTKTGALTNIPDENGVISNNDPDDFEPPTEAKMEDKLDLMTKKALDKGVPLDEAVTKGRKMIANETLSHEELITEQINEQNTAPKVIKYNLPDINLLTEPKAKKKPKEVVKEELEDKANKLLDTLSSFKVEAKIINITQGPSVTRFELQPGFGVKVSKITGLSDDIALSLAAPGIRIEAPIPGKSAIGIEIPNVNPTPVPIREVLDTPEFRNKKSKTTVALGKDISGSCVIADISNFPHILIAGATGSGKSVCINSLITSVLYKAKPDEVKMIMIDPKMVELGVYNGIPHLLIPVVTDPKHAAGALNWAVVEMQNRYNLLKDNKVRNLEGYNKLMDSNNEPDAKLPEIVIIIDELADLMTVAKSEVEEAINRLAALARAAGMYLIIATQRPSVNVITGVIKANVPSRISFSVSSQIDSRTIIDSAGAEKLLGKGDMLYSPRGSMKPLRVQGNFVSDGEIEAIVDYIKNQYEAEYDEEVIEHIEKEHDRVSAELDSANAPHTAAGSGGSSIRADDMFFDAIELILENGQASVAMFQRKFKMGYQRAAKLIDQMEEKKIIGPYEGTKPRQVLITRQEFNEMKYNQAD